MCTACCNKNSALTMADISDLKPQYISNIAADYWRQNSKTSPETMIGLCSKKIEIITKEQGTDKLNSSLTPGHIKLADAMSTAAMITRPPTRMDDKFEAFYELQLILGWSALNINSDPKHEYCCGINKVYISVYLCNRLINCSNHAPFLFVRLILRLKKKGRDARRKF